MTGRHPLAAAIGQVFRGLAGLAGTLVVAGLLFGFALNVSWLLWVAVISVFVALPAWVLAVAFEAAAGSSW